MLIAVEGGDGTGKTTFCNALAELVPNAERLHFGQPKHESIFHEYECIDDYKPGQGRHIISDRYHLGELIYGPLYRGGSKLDGPGLLHVELYLRAKGALLVHLTAAAETIYARIYDETADRDEDFLQKMHVETVLRSYSKYTTQTRLKTLHFANGEHVGTEWTISMAKRIERRARHLASYNTYVGYEDPSLLLVGETHGRLNQGHAAAFVPYPATSGHYLLSSLLAVGCPRIGLVNALQDDVDSLWRALGCPPVVALGRVASKELTKVGIVHGAVPHPQFIRRFHHGKSEEYGRLILKVSNTREDQGSWPTS